MLSRCLFVAAVASDDCSKAAAGCGLCETTVSNAARVDVFEECVHKNVRGMRPKSIVAHEAVIIFLKPKSTAETLILTAQLMADLIKS